MIQKFRPFQNAKIRQQILGIYFIVTFLPIVLIGGFLLINTGKLLNNYYTDLLEADNQRVKTTLFEITTQVYNISEDLALNQNIRQAVMQDYNAGGEMPETGMIGNYISSYAEIDSIEIYTDNPGCEGIGQFAVVDEEANSVAWYQEALTQNAAFWIPLDKTDEYGNVYWHLCLVRRIPTAESGYHGVLMICLSDNYLRTRIESREYKILISANDESVFYSSDRTGYGQALPVTVTGDPAYFSYSGELQEGKSKSLVSVSTLALYQSDSRLYICVINSEAFHHTVRFLLICIGIILIAAVVPGIMIYWFTGYFTGRILTLRHAMHQASSEDYEITSFVQGKDEISEAFVDLQIMIQNIKQKDARMYEARLKEQRLINEQQKMEFKMLFAQINPHFLFNTLETIRMKAIKAGDREAASAIKLLGKSMRYVLETVGTADVAMERELEHVENYLAIQKLRFGEKFDSEIVIDPDLEIEKVSILPLLLQPIVENAIVHGLEEKESGGKIRITIERKMEEEELLLLTVSDNGCGMGEEELTQLREKILKNQIGQSKSIGLTNVNQRIRLCYGTQYGLEINSVPGEGTRVCVKLPYEKAVECEK